MKHFPLLTCLLFMAFGVSAQSARGPQVVIVKRDAAEEVLRQIRDTGRVSSASLSALATGKGNTEEVALVLSETTATWLGQDRRYSLKRYEDLRQSIAVTLGVPTSLTRFCTEEERRDILRDYQSPRTRCRL